MRQLPSSFSVALGLCFILPLLNYFRDPPISDFFGEWSSALLMALGALFMVRGLPRRLDMNGLLFVVPAVLAAVVLTQLALSRYAYPTDAFFPLAYLGMFVLVVLLGQHFRSDGMTAEVTRRMAWAIVLVGLVNLVAQITQLGRWAGDLQPWVVRLQNDSVCVLYGNTGQANQTSTIAWLALLGTLYLAHERRMPGGLLPLLAALFMFSSALTTSRMAWLFLALTVAGVVVARPRWAGSLAGRLAIAGALVVAFAVVTLGTSALVAEIDPTCRSSLARLAEGRASTGFSARVDFLGQAALVWLQSPWLGAGAGSLRGMAYHLLGDERSQPLDPYAHNILAQLAAEYGVVAALTLLVVVAACLLAVYRNRRELGAADAVLAGWLGVLGIHSLLEYPLWYVHFLMFCGLAIGLLIRPQWRLLTVQVPARWLVGGLSAIALFVCVLLFRDYQNLDRLMFLVMQKVESRIGSSPQVDALFAGADAGIVIFRPNAEHLLGAAMSMSRDGLAEKIEATDKLMLRAPVPQTIARRVVLAVLADDPATARHHMRRLLLFYPDAADDLIEQMHMMARERPDELGSLATVLDEAVASTPKRRS